MTPLPCRITAADTPLWEVDADWLVLGVPSNAESSALERTIDEKIGGSISRLRQSGDLTGKRLDLVPILTPTGVRARRLLLTGLGSTETTSRATVNDAFAAALRSITGRKFARVAIVVPDGDVATSVLGAIVGAIQGGTGPGLRKSEPSRHLPDELIVLGSNTNLGLVGRAHVEAAAVAFSRELVNTPAADLYPETFVARALEDSRVEFEVWDEKRLEAERMGAILGVAGASARPPRMLIARYRNGGARPTLALVGKGVTFDSGGLSLKTTEQMADMKADMAGAAAVLAAIEAAAELALPVNLLGVMPLVENMPGGRALKLGDVLRARNGKTIEVLNTDAEGRLILADALAYAAEQRPGHIVDLATLTGSCMVALGTEIAGLMTNNEPWGDFIRATARRAGERAWPLPMDADFDDLLKSKVADLKNVPPSRYGGAIAGGKFLEQFVGGLPWAHLDIAGPAWADNESPARDAGGTGAFVRTLIELAATYGE